MTTYRIIITIALVLGVLTLISVGVVAARRISLMNEEARLAEHSQEVIAQVQRVLALEVDAETGARGFAITAENPFLEPYTESRARIDEAIARLTALVADNPSQMARARELAAAVARHTAALAQLIEVRRASGFEAARQFMSLDQGTRVMDQTRIVADAMIQDEQNMLVERKRRAATGFQWTRAAALAGAVAVVLALMLAVIQMATELQKRRAAEASVRSAYQEVEQKVKARTLELERALEQLQVSEEQFRVVAELSPVYLFRTDAHGAWEFVSTSFVTFTGLPPERARGFGWTEAVDPEDRGHLLNAWQAATSARRPFDAECRFRSKDGQSRWFRIRVVPRLPDDAGGNPSWIGAAVDIHDLKDALSARAIALGHAQEAQRDSEAANQLKDEFLATASHELRTPLNAIVGWAHVLKVGEVTQEERSHAVDAIERNAKAQTRLIEDMLDVSGMIQGRLNMAVSSVDLRTAVQEAIATVSPAARARNLQLDVQVGDEPVIIDGDPKRLQQVAWNLLSNAVKFTAKGGHVWVQVERMGSRARLRVEDNGEGIDPAFLPHVFESFRQGPSATMRTGLGLGLAIVRRLVELHGGTITADSAGPGRGASFMVTLPLHVSAPLASVAAGGKQPASLVGVKVLIAEDDDDSAAALAAVLRLHGCHVLTARTASECLRMLGDWHPDVLLCDVGLPDDDGYSLLRRARSTPGGADTPAIALTAFTGENDRVRALAAGFKAHIPKPFDPDTLLREITSAMPARAQPL
jgi:PAS domain S-box-containing protein